MFAGQHVVLGVTGSIAAYKAAELARRLVQAQAEVTVVMTENACRFITPLTFRTLTNRPVATEFFSDPVSPVPHVSLAKWADLILVAPATADILARAAVGRADDLLTAVILDTAAPILWAPAMNVRMWENPITQENVRRLTAQGHQWILPTEGELACLESGRGRLAEVERIVETVRQVLSPSGPLAGKKVLITAGPTYEAWDAIRFLSNRSSGRMGYSLAHEAQRRGAEVTLVSGPVALTPPAGVRVIHTTTAQEMYTAAMAEFAKMDVVIAAAAVADFRPAQVFSEKIKKTLTPPPVELIPNPDILLEMGKQKRQQILVGFAAECEEPAKAGAEKRARKNCDLMVANYAAGPEDAFASESATVMLIDTQDNVQSFPRQSKNQVAALICDRIEEMLAQ